MRILGCVFRVTLGVLILWMISRPLWAALPTEPTDTILLPEPRITRADLNRPDWLSELDVDVEMGWDSNVYLQRVTDLANRDSLLTAVTPKVGFELQPFFERAFGAEADGLQTFELTACAEAVKYWWEPSQDYVRFCQDTVTKGTYGPWTLLFENAFQYVYGSRTATTYTGLGGPPAIGGFQVRNRRRQIQERLRFVLRYDVDEDWFLRASTGLIHYDFQTILKQNVPGYRNYRDRADVHGGLDLGRRVMRDLYVVAGYRRGHQHQATVFGLPFNNSNNYDRALLGLEGHVAPWAKLTLSAGPTWVNYTSTILPRTPRSQVLPYYKCLVDFTLSPNDTLSLKLTRFHWLASGGPASYSDQVYATTYKRHLRDGLDVATGFQGYRGDFFAPVARDDWILSAYAKLTCSFNEQLVGNVGYHADVAISAIPNTPGREYTRHIVAADVTLLW